MIECDLILLVWNEPEYTRQAIESIFRNTDVEARLIIVDNASASQTADYLKTIKPQGMIKEVLLLRNERNKGYAGGMNEGLKRSNAPYVCLLNNDILVSEGWLSEMIKVASSSSKIGLVNPSSNTTGQHIIEPNLKSHSGKWAEMGWCVGFCMLIKGGLLKKIGYLDEIFDTAYFEDQDYSRRAQAAGYICARAKAGYVWHFEGASTKRLRLTREKLFKKNAGIFHRRWGKPRRIAYVILKPSSAACIKAGKDALMYARQNNWVTIFKRNGAADILNEEHSNLTVIGLPHRFFYINVIWKILKKKKRFDKVILV